MPVQCGCLCTTCCTDEKETDCREATQENPCNPDLDFCKTYDEERCGIQYSNGQQASFCAIESPSMWPALLQVCASMWFLWYMQR